MTPRLSSLLSITILMGCAAMNTLAAPGVRGPKKGDNDGGGDNSDNDLKGVVTCPSQNLYLAELFVSSGGASPRGNTPTLLIDPMQQFQEIQGFGYTLTGGSAQHLMGLSAAKRAAILEELFSPTTGKGISTLRIPVGASDLDSDPYSYNDLDNLGLTEDPNLFYFTMERDYEFRIPLLHEIKAINPNIQLMATPWSAPSWMKDTKTTVGGSLIKEYFPVYANYLVKFLQEMDNEGLHVELLTIQNEPLNWHNNPSMYMLWWDQRDFIRDALHPAVSGAGLTTKLLLYDHNADVPSYATDILSDSSVYDMVEGSAFHLYGGSIDALSQVKDAFPEKAVHFTEQWVSSDGQFEGDLMWHSQNILIGGLQNHAATVLEWNLSSDPNMMPHTDGGCENCLGAITIDNTADEVVARNVAYYLLAHASPHLPRGSFRIGSSWSGNGNPPSDVDQVVLQHPTSGDAVVLVANRGGGDTRIALGSTQVTDTIAQIVLPPRSLYTLIIPSAQVGTNVGI